MNEEQNTRMVREAYAAFQRGDIAGVLNTMSDDVAWLLPSLEGVPVSGKRQGREQVREFFATLAATQEAEEFDPKEIVAQDDTVVALGHYRWRVLATGRRFESDFAHVFTVKDGKVARFREYFDTSSAMLAYSGS